MKNSREEMQAHREDGNPDVGRAAQKLERFQDAESLEAYAKGTPAESLRDLLREGGKGWQHVHACLRKYGLEIEKADQGGYVVRASDSELRVKASSVFRENFSGKANRARTEKQLGGWESPKRFVQVRDAEQSYQPQPRGDPEKRASRRAERAAQREQFRKEYRAYRATAEKALTAYRSQASAELRKLGAVHRAKRKELRKLPVGHIEKRAIRSVLAAEAVRERAALKQRLLEDRAVHRSKSYREWVAERAAQGDATAISQLRGFLYQDRRRVLEMVGPVGAVSIQSGGGGDWREWNDTFDVTEQLRRRKLFTDLQTLQGSVDQRTGHVAYVIDGQQALLDVGQKIHLLDQREATLVAGLEMAVHKFGVRLEVFGTDEQKRQIALAAAKHGMVVEFTDQALQMAYQQDFKFQNGRGLERERGGIEL